VSEEGKWSLCPVIGPLKGEKKKEDKKQTEIGGGVTGLQKGQEKMKPKGSDLWGERQGTTKAKKGGGNK